MSTTVQILTAAGLIEAAINPTVTPALVAGDLLRDAALYLSDARDAAEHAGGAALVAEFRRIEQAARRLSEVSTDGSTAASRAQSRLAALATACDDAHARWALIAPTLTAAQSAVLRAAFAG